jgi:hypothetical protein
MTLTISGEPAASGDAPAEIRIDGLAGRNAPQMGVGSGTIHYQRDVRALDIAATGGPFARVRLVPRSPSEPQNRIRTPSSRRRRRLASSW